MIITFYFVKMEGLSQIQQIQLRSDSVDLLEGLGKSLLFVKGITTTEIEKIVIEELNK